MIYSLVLASVLINSTNSGWTISERTIQQVGGSWEIDYVLRNNTKAPVEIIVPTLQFRLEGWVSNSRVPGHNIPVHSKIKVDGDTSSESRICYSDSEEFKCEEKVLFYLWKKENRDYKKQREALRWAGVEPLYFKKMVVRCGEEVRFFLVIHHNHSVYGLQDPLLGNIKLYGVFGIPLRDKLVFDSFVPQGDKFIFDSDKKEYSPMIWKVPEDRKDATFFLSSPDSLCISAHIPGNQYFRFQERSVRRGTRLKVRFYYYIAHGSLADFHFRSAQYKDTRTAWKVLSEGSEDEHLKIIGKWTLFEKIINLEDKCNTIAFDFRLKEEDVGEAWVDDFTCDELGKNYQKGP